MVSRQKKIFRCEYLQIRKNKIGRDFKWSGVKTFGRSKNLSNAFESCQARDQG